MLLYLRQPGDNGDVARNGLDDPQPEVRMRSVELCQGDPLQRSQPHRLGATRPPRPSLLVRSRLDHHNYTSHRYGAHRRLDRESPLHNVRRRSVRSADATPAGRARHFLGEASPEAEGRFAATDSFSCREGKALATTRLIS